MTYESQKSKNFYNFNNYFHYKSCTHTQKKHTHNIVKIIYLLCLVNHSVDYYNMHDAIFKTFWSWLYVPNQISDHGTFVLQGIDL